MKKTAKKTVSQKQYDEACMKYYSMLVSKGKLEAAQKEAMQKAQDKYVQGIKDADEVLTATFETIKAYCEANREDMFAFAKSLDTGSGITVGFRMGQKKLDYGDGVKPDDLLAVLKRKKLVQYIATKESVDARAIIQAEEDKKLGNALQGIGCAVVQIEEFFVKPS